MIDPKPRKYECVCKGCGVQFTFVAIGPSRLCDDCDKVMRDFIFSRIPELPAQLKALL